MCFGGVGRAKERGWMQGGHDGAWSAFRMARGRSSENIQPVGMKMDRMAVFVALAMALFSSTAGAMSREEEAEISRAGLLIEERRPAEALALLEPLLAANPDLPGVHYQAALAAQMTGDSAKASKLGRMRCMLFLRAILSSGGLPEKRS